MRYWINLRRLSLLASVGLLAATFFFYACEQAGDEGKTDHQDNAAEKEGKNFETGESFSGRNAWLHAKAICDLGPRPNQSKALAASRAYIAETMSGYGWGVTEQVFIANTPLGKRQFTNLIARFGVDPAEESTLPPVGILAGHIDTKLFTDFEFIGANDGASHTGLLLELARYLAQRPAYARQLEVVFFDGEEAFNKNIVVGVDGLYGSTYYAKFLRGQSAADKAQWAIVVDMVGLKELRIEVPSDTPPELFAIYRSAAKEIPDGRRIFGTAAGPIIDDHLPLNLAGVPAIDIIQGGFSQSNWWHREGDTFDKLSPKSLQKTGDLVTKMIDQLLD